MKCSVEDCPYCYYDRLDEMYKCRETWEEVKILNGGVKGVFKLKEVLA